MWKKLMTGLLMAVVLVTLTACGSSSTGTASQTTASTTKAEVGQSKVLVVYFNNGAYKSKVNSKETAGLRLPLGRTQACSLCRLSAILFSFYNTKCGKEPSRAQASLRLCGRY